MFGLSSSTGSLCIAAITHTYLLFHCYPYLGYMSVTLLKNKEDCTTVDDAGLYAGLLGTAFTLGRCLSFIPWKIARHHNNNTNTSTSSVGGGIKNTLLLSLFLSSICSIWFGMSQTFVSAILARFCLGLSNTISGCVKRGAINHEKHVALQRHNNNTTRIQIFDKKEKLKLENSNSRQEELAPSKVLSVMHWGSCIGPFVGGLLSQSGTYKQDTILPELFDIHYPFLLPNAVGALLCVLSMFIVYKYFIEEDDIKPESIHNSKVSSSTKKDKDEESPQEANETRPLLKVLSKQQSETDDVSTAIKNIWKSTNTKNHLLAYFSFSFVVVCIDEGLPLFLIARLAGPGLSPKQIGYILGTAGLINVLSQTIKIKRLLGDDSDNTYYPTLKWTSVLGNLPSILFPLVLVFNGGTYYYVTTSTLFDDDSNNEEEEGKVLNDESLGPSGKLSWLGFIFLVLLVGFMKSMDSIYFSLIGVATGRTVPSNYKDQVARIMTLGALYARAIAPVISGLLVSIFMSSEFIYEGTSSVLLWFVIGFIFSCIAIGYNFSLKAGGILAMGSPKRRDGSGGSTCGTGTDIDNDSSSSSSLITSSRTKRKLSHSQLMYLNNRQRAQIYVKLWEVHYDKDSNTVASKWRRLTRKAIAYNRMTKMTMTTTTSGQQQQQQKDIDEGKATNLIKKKRPSWADHMIQPGLDLENTTFLILGTHKKDKSCLPHVLTPPMMFALQAELPFVCSEDNFWLKYSLVRDGAFVHMLESKIEWSKNTIIAIETLEGDVFGCFMANPWKKNNKYEVCAQSFLWRMKHKRENPTLSTGDSNNDEALLDEIARKEGDIEVFKYTGNGDQCQLFSEDRIAAGGGIVDGSDGFGFLVEDNLSRGTTSPCATYGNPILLVGNDDNNDDPSMLSLGGGGGGGEAKTNLGQFEVANMEVWCMTPFIDIEEAEQSLMTLRFIKGNTKGDAPSSGQSAWTNFL